MPDRRMLLDTAGVYFRAFYSVPDSVTAPNGIPVNAVRGTLDAIARLATEFRPAEVVACWDDDWRPQWRVQLISSYKTHRVSQVVEVGPDVEVVPDPLSAQIPVIRAALEALGIPVVGAAEHEADDVIGTLATAGEHVDIVTGDRDLFQLIDDARDVRVIYTGRGMSKLEILTDDALVAKYGVRPDQYADFAAMRGDASDGLPGVSGIGEKSAATLLAQFGDLDGILAAVADPDSGLSAGQRAKFAAAADYLTVAPRVVQVVRDLALPQPVFSPPDRQAAEALAAEWGLSSSMERVLAALTGFGQAG
jgi:5'-3' exonuclease